MGNSAKTDNFLKAIKKYAKAQKNQIQKEVRQLRDESAKLTEQQAQRDSEKLINDKLEQKRSEQTAILARKTQKGQKALFEERVKMTEEVFATAEQKLLQYTQTDDYRQKLESSAARIAELFRDKECVLFLREQDMGFADALCAPFNGKASVKADKTIRIGGVKGYCKEMRMIADETLDSKLLSQREWFVENAELRVDA